KLLGMAIPSQDRTLAAGCGSDRRARRRLIETSLTRASNSGVLNATKPRTRLTAVAPPAMVIIAGWTSGQSSSSDHTPMFSTYGTAGGDQRMGVARGPPPRTSNGGRPPQARLTARNLIDEALRDLVVAADAFGLYSLLHELGPTTPTQVARWTGMAPTTVSGMARRLPTWARAGPTRSRRRRAAAAPGAGGPPGCGGAPGGAPCRRIRRTGRRRHRPVRRRAPDPR